jgi:hypothetical protein
VRRPRLTNTERRAKWWITKRFGLSSNGNHPTDKALCAWIAEKTGWPLPTGKPARREYMARFWYSLKDNELSEEVLAAQVVKPRRKPGAWSDFYASREWRVLRYRALKLHGATCQCCGASAKDGKVMHVDHIKPRSKYPALQLVLSNLQVLCEDCNLGKLAHDETDWRPVEEEILPDGAAEHMHSLN